MESADAHAVDMVFHHPVFNHIQHIKLPYLRWDYRNDIRRFLKGDEGLLSQALGYHRCNPKEHGVVNYLADYDGVHPSYEGLDVLSEV